MIRGDAKTLTMVVALVSLVGCTTFDPSDEAVLPEWPDPILTLEPYTFQAREGTEVEAEKGHYWVPENRDDPNSRMIKIGFVRFRATGSNPGAPIVYLAGGPGGTGTGTAARRRFSLFMALREYGDVIAFDQRGTGLSETIQPCKTDHTYPLDQPLERKAVVSLYHKAANECAKRWKEAGVDLQGYNTQQSALDIVDLKRALGADQISLWGISYGSHLAFAVIREMDSEIDRAILAGIEGPEATVKLPERTDKFFDRLQAAIIQDKEAAAAYPDLKGLMRQVHNQLDSEPAKVSFKQRDGQSVSFTLGKMDMQLLSSFSISDPFRSRTLPSVYAAALEGNFVQAAPIIYSFLRKDPIEFRGMPEAMDIMSGISEKRLAKIKDQAQHSLLADNLNFPMPHLIDAFDLSPLQNSFRGPVRSDVSTLVFVGTLDGRTYPEGASFALQHFSNAHQVKVVNGGHNVFMQDPVIAEIIHDFMKGETVPTEVKLATPEFVIPTLSEE